MNKQIKGKSENEKNYLHGKAPNKQKKNKEIFLDFLFSATTKHALKVNYYNYFFLVFLKFFKHTRRKQENKFNIDDTIKKCEHRQIEWYVNMNIMSVRNTYSPKLRLLA